MYTPQQYINDNITLAKSIVIKLSDIGIQINNSLKNIFNIDTPSDKHEWKYFLNLSGQLHHTNTTDIKINIIELDEIRPFSKEILEKYPETKKALTIYGSYYDEFIYSYPDDIDYINGCINPIDIDIAISVTDGDILTYNTELVEKQELSTMRELNDYIKNYIHRWHLKNYMVVDELYLSAMLATLYASLPIKLMNIRLAKVRSNEAHSFHVEHYFRSNFNLWDDVKVLNKKSLWWLYNNLEYIKKNTGKEATTDLILNKIFNANNIGVGKMMLGFQDATLKTNATVNESAYNDANSKIISVKANNSYFTDSNNIRSTDALIRAQLSDKNIISDLYKDDNFYISIFDNKINSKNNVLEDTKTFDINSVKLLDIHGINLFETVIDTWVHKAYNDKYLTLQYFTDPNTKNRYTISPKQGILIFIKMLSLLYQDNNQILSNYYYNNIVLPAYDKVALLDNLFTKNDLSDIVDTILSKVPSTNFISNKGDFTKYIEKILQLLETVKLLDSNIETLSISTDLKAISNRILQRGTITISSGETIDQLLSNENIDLGITGLYDPKKTIAKLLLVFTGIDIDVYKKFVDINDHYMAIFNKLTSYTTQISYTDDDAKSLYAKYTAISVNHISEGVITINEAHAVPLELEETIVNGLGNNFTDRIDSFFMSNISIFKYDSCGITGICEILGSESNISARITEPMVTIEVLNDCIPYYAPTVKSASNNYVPDISATSSDGINIQEISKININPVIAYTDDNTTNQPTGDLTTPNAIVEIDI